MEADLDGGVDSIVYFDGGLLGGGWTRRGLHLRCRARVDGAGGREKGRRAEALSRRAPRRAHRRVVGAPITLRHGPRGCHRRDPVTASPAHPSDRHRHAGHPARLRLRCGCVDLTSLAPSIASQTATATSSAAAQLSFCFLDSIAFSHHLAP